MSDSRLMMTGTIPLQHATEAVEVCKVDDNATKAGFPFDVGERFEFIERLGRGGTGLVYKAFDHRLARHVAVKFLINTDESSRPHLVAEARAQANIEHPNVCRIYEVVEADDYIFIVMQYIEGASLRALVSTISAEQVLIVLAKSAFALHDAHKKGIIHRDLKPDNIVVEMADGQLEPYVVDFGLAWNIQKDGHHQGKMTIGTPGFIAPELLSGQALNRDRRGDVYSLGMSLLFCLTQEHPAFLSANPDQVKPAVQYLPTDVGIIIQKALEQDPAQRYASAEAFGQDIERYLSGEPIKARPGRVYWAKQKLIKHRWLALLVSTFAISLGGLYGKHLYSQHLQSLREEALLAYNQKISALEYEAQLTYLSPAHDIEQTKAEWLASANAIESQLASAHPATLGASHYALGRIYQLVGEQQQAFTHLQEAYALEPGNKVAFYLAQAYGALFSEHLQAVRNIEDKTVRNARLQQIDTLYKQPAEQLMGQSIASAPYRSYAESLLLYYQNQWEEALSLLENSNGLPAWYYLDEVLKGDILLAQATQQYESGVSPEQVKPLIESALASYAQAQDIAPSDPNVAVKPLSALLFSLRMQNQSGQAQSEAWINDVTERVNQAKAIDAQNDALYLSYGQILQFFGGNQQQHAGTPTLWFEEAEAALLTGLALSDRKDDYWLSLGRLYSSMIKYQKEANLDTNQAMEKAIAALERVSQAGRDYYYYNELGTMSRNRAQYIETQGEDPEPLYQAAVDAYLMANQRFPEHIGSLINAASTIRLMSTKFELSQKRAALYRAIDLLQKVLDKDPVHFVANYYMAVIAVNLVESAVLDEANLAMRVDSLDALSQVTPITEQEQAVFALADTRMQELLAVNNTHPYVLNLVSRLKHLKMESALTHQLRWSSNIDDIIAERKKLAQEFPKNPIVVSSYIGIMGVMTHTRLLLSLPAETYMQGLEEALQDYPEFENKEVFQALLALFQHWNDDSRTRREIANSLVARYALNGKTNHTYRNGNIVFDLIRAESQAEYQTALNSLEGLREGITPSYKKLLLIWASTQNFNK